MSTGKTQQLTVNSGARSAITAFGPATEIVIQEDPSVANWPTTDFLVSKPGSADTQRRVQAGGQYVFRKIMGIYQAGDTIGYVQTVAGSTTFNQDEGGV